MAIERGEMIVAAAKEILPRVGSRRNNLPLDLRLACTIEPQRHPAPFSGHDDMIPTPGREDGLSGENLVALIAVEDNQPPGDSRRGRAADAKMIPRCPCGIGGAAREKIGGNGAGLVAEIAAKPAGDTPVVIESVAVPRQPAAAEGGEGPRIEADGPLDREPLRRLGQRPGLHRPDRRHLRGMVSGKRGRVCQPKAFFVCLAPSRLGSGSLLAKTRLLPQRGHPDRIESAVKERHLVELSLQAFSEDDRRRRGRGSPLQHRLRVAVEIDFDSIAAADDCHLMPVVGAEAHLCPLLAKRKAERVVGILPGDEWFGGEASAQRPLAGTCATSLAQPHPGDERGIAGRGFAGKDELTAGQMNRSVDGVGLRKRRWHEGLAVAAAAPCANAGEIPGKARCKPRWHATRDGIVRCGTILVVEPPEANRLGSQQPLGRRSVALARHTPRLPRHLLKRGHEGLDDLRFGSHFEAGSPGRPGGVAAEDVLLWRRDVAFGTVGQFDVEVHARRRAAAQFESGERIDLVGERGDRDITDTDRLEGEARLLPLVEDQRLAGVDLGDVLGKVIDDPRGNRLGPCQPRRIRHPVGKRQDFFSHRQRHVVAILDRFQHGDCVAGHRGGVLLDRCGTLRGAVVHPH